MFDHVSKHLELLLKNSAAPHFSTSVLGVWKHDQTLMRVFDLLHVCTMYIVDHVLKVYMAENSLLNALKVLP